MYPPERSERWAASFCPSAGSQPVSLPPAAASPACFPGIRRLPSPRTRLLAGTSQANYPSVKWQNEREDHFQRASRRKKKKLKKKNITFCAFSHRPSTFCQPLRSFLLKAEECCDLLRGRRRQDKVWDCSTVRQETFFLRQNVGWNVLYAKDSCCWDNWGERTQHVIGRGTQWVFQLVLKNWIRHRLYQEL